MTAQMTLATTMTKNRTSLPKYQPRPTAIFAFENTFDPKFLFATVEEYRIHFLFLLGIFYLVIFLLKSYMDTRERFKIRRALMYWNFALSAGSALSWCRIMPELVYCVRELSFQYSICIPSYISENSVTSFWCTVLAVMRVLELGDTVFLVLRKRKLTFLHLYHHGLVYIYLVFVATSCPGFLRWGTCINTGIHAVMYFYYGIRASGFVVHKNIAMAITTSQISQMAFGIVVCGSAYYFRSIGEDCYIPENLLRLSVLVVLSLLVLFGNFFVKTYLKTKSGEEVEKLKVK